MINVCPIEELMSLPGVGEKVADIILEIRERNGNLQMEDLRHVPYLKLTPQLINCLDFSLLQEGERLGQRKGSIDDRHRERVQRVDQKRWWKSGKGQVQATHMEWQRIGDNYPRANKKGKSLIKLRRNGTGGKGHYHLRGWRTTMARWIQLSRRNRPPGEEDRGYVEGPRRKKGESAPGQSKPSVRRMRGDEFELDSCPQQRDRAHMHDFQNRPVGVGPESATHRGPPPVSGGVESMSVVETWKDRA